VGVICVQQSVKNFLETLGEHRLIQVNLRNSQALVECMTVNAQNAINYLTFILLCTMPLSYGWSGCKYRWYTSRGNYFNKVTSISVTTLWVQ